MKQIAIFGFLEDKDAVEFVRILKPLVSKAWAAAEPDCLVCITGSLYMKQMLLKGGCI